jgi:hypothetical protein
VDVATPTITSLDENLQPVGEPEVLDPRGYSRWTYFNHGGRE